MRPPVVCFHGTNCNLLGVAPRVLSSTTLSQKPECLPIEVPAKATVAKLLLPIRYHSGSPDGGLQRAHSWPQKGWILEASNLQGLEEWPEVEQEWARELLLKWEHLFAHSNLDLGKTSLIKHQIELTDLTPFKEHY